MNKQKAPRFSLAALTLLAVAVLATLLTATASTAEMIDSDGGSSGCTLVSTQGQSTQKAVCGEPAQICTTTTVQVPQASSQEVTPGRWYDCLKSYWEDGYWDYEQPPCYSVAQDCETTWDCDEFGYCWPTGCTPLPPAQVCPPAIEVWVPGRTYTYTDSCWQPPVYQDVTTLVPKEERVCTPNCWVETVPGPVTYSLNCPAATTTPALVTPAPTPTPTPATAPAPYSNPTGGALGSAAAGVVNSYFCAQKPNECQGNSVITWGYNLWSGNCEAASTTPCASGETCSSGKCQRQITCDITCSGDVARTQHIETFPTGEYYCRSSYADMVDCAAQGKVCQEGVGCVARTAANDCTSLGCPSGYYCTLYPQEA